MSVATQNIQNKFDPSGEEKSLDRTALVSTNSVLNYFIELRTSSLIDYISKLYSNNGHKYTRQSINDWLFIRTKTGFYKELSSGLHLAYADQRDGHKTQHWWTLFFNDDYKQDILRCIKIEIGLVKSKTSPNESNSTHQWGGLNFRSKTEVRIAHALHSQPVLFFANSRAFMDLTDLPISNIDNRLKERIEVDFLVFYKQKCMILEVDGEHHQQAAQQARDYRRDRVLLRDGIQTVRFNANECYSRPLEVVAEFLNLF
ncbi:DUF559 domain-containing protein [Nostoc sp. FACHB-87]|uniref:endonuclease domain-containing protein n=1 Tax=Nostocaceae TaxID=1162 RepID=UPI00168678B3|nr:MULTISPECIES: DUF559 domain-containing protein [Nostocaceae]MBD2457286.1 DUF559 domain-containing protein [Nostoc sp. FACHB-87]MBD2478355.1 DUF559 domain-containing protein [Anabaena sp. FACHB-83]